MTYQPSLPEAAAAALTQAQYSQTDYDPTLWTKPDTALPGFRLLQSGDSLMAVQLDVRNGSEVLLASFRLTPDNLPGFVAIL